MGWLKWMDTHELIGIPSLSGKGQVSALGGVESGGVESPILGAGALGGISVLDVGMTGSAVRAVSPASVLVSRGASISESEELASLSPDSGASRIPAKSSPWVA
ncbi:MAG: hypothetical protein PVI30_08030 [Myxococcales bacterium]|jgi:hypothetical protein